MSTIVVPVKQVMSFDDEFELAPGARGVDPDFVDRDLNDWDTFSVEAAVAIKELHGDTEVVVITVGDEDSEEVLVDCLARGADRAIRISCDDASRHDPLQIAEILAAVTAREVPALVLCGVQSSDAASSATGVALAGYLDLPHVAVVRRIELLADERKVRVERELEAGMVEEIELPLPCLLTMQTGANEPRYATLRAIKQAADRPLDVLELADLDLDATAVAASRGAIVTELTNRPKGEGAQMLGGDADQIADEILTILQERVGLTRGVDQ